jgi:hypothetical protein
MPFPSGPFARSVCRLPCQRMDGQGGKRLASQDKVPPGSQELKAFSGGPQYCCASRESREFINPRVPTKQRQSDLTGFLPRLHRGVTFFAGLDELATPGASSRPTDMRLAEGGWVGGNDRNGLLESSGRVWVLEAKQTGHGGERNTVSWLQRTAIQGWPDLGAGPVDSLNTNSGSSRISRPTGFRVASGTRRSNTKRPMRSRGICTVVNRG